MKIAQKTKFMLTKCYSTSIHCLPKTTNYERTVIQALKTSSSHSTPLINGQHHHARIIKSGHDSNVFIRNSLINFYIKFGTLQDAESIFHSGCQSDGVSCNIMLFGYVSFGSLYNARQLFDQMPERNLVSWHTIIRCVLQVGNLREALKLYREMQSNMIQPNNVMIVRIISVCGQVMAFIEGQQFHCISLKLGFDTHDFIQSKIIHFYAVCQNIKLAQIQFEIGSKNHLPSWNAFVSGLVRNGMVESARHVFNYMPARDVFSWSSMISGYSQTDQPHMALDLFYEMVSSGIKPNEVTMVSMLSSVANLGNLQEGIRAHEFIVKNSVPINDNLSAGIIDMYAKCGSINNALQFFNQVKNDVSTISPWNAIIQGLAMHDAILSLEMFLELEKRGIELNSITFIGVLSACCHAGLVKEGEKQFKNMKNVYNLEPNIKHYGCMVDLLGRAGKLEEAEELIKSMPMKADVVIWGTLLAASRNYGNVEMGERAAENLATAEPSHGPGRILLSNLYIDAGRFDDAVFVRREMQNQRLTRSSGYSGII
ncbi:pentatricopeptide repeat-containing protein At5g19020, mitochondrial-like [Rutidosis leptorrhynchoides]|uniref:pentatricopeptide repeat-containing protein At5g19020, mitochondrial-like n=1 Tax=Rutidosis leptorrhynchoides TaxID=125765 RepID=UPI003A9A4DAA